jgi:ribosome-binding protein aMBF1 (putative translation factor)
MDCPNCGKKNIKKGYKIEIDGEEKIFCDECKDKRGDKK